MRSLQERMLIQEIRELDREAEHGGWHYISWNIPLTEDLIYRARDFMDWKGVVMFQPVTTPFLKEHRDRLVFPSVIEAARVQNKDPEFMTEFERELVIHIETPRWIKALANVETWLVCLPYRLNIMMSRWANKE